MLSKKIFASILSIPLYRSTLSRNIGLYSLCALSNTLQVLFPAAYHSWTTVKPYRTFILIAYSKKYTAKNKQRCGMVYVEFSPVRDVTAQTADVQINSLSFVLCKFDNWLGTFMALLEYSCNTNHFIVTKLRKLLIGCSPIASNCFCKSAICDIFENQICFHANDYFRNTENVKAILCDSKDSDGAEDTFASKTDNGAVLWATLPPCGLLRQGNYCWTIIVTVFDSFPVLLHYFSLLHLRIIY